MVMRTTVLALAALLTVGGCTLYDPKGRPPPGEGFDAGAGFGVSSRPRPTVDFTGAPRLLSKDDAPLTDGLTRLQRNGLLQGCDMLFATQPDKRRACKGGDYAFAEALQVGCTERHRDDQQRRRECLAPVAE